MELCHLVGYKLSQGRHISLIWLYPSPDSVTGHRVVSEILVDLATTSGSEEVLGPVAVRFSEAWGDWSICEENDFFRAEGSGSVSMKIDPTSGGAVVGDTLVEKVQRLVPGCGVVKERFLHSLSQAVREIMADGKVVVRFEEEVVHRQEDGDGNKFSQIIRLALHCAPHCDASRIEVSIYNSSDTIPVHFSSLASLARGEIYHLIG